MLTLLIINLSNCRKNHDGCPETTIDSTHFDSSELAKIPDWKGDSLFFYSNAGDTAYMVCTVQYGGYESYDGGGGYDAECGNNRFSYYPEYNYKYISNHPDLNGIRVVIYKESNAYHPMPGPPTAIIDINKLGNFLLSDLGNSKLFNDSISFENKQTLYGRWNMSEDCSLNINYGFLKIILSNGRKWTLFDYSLN